MRALPCPRTYLTLTLALTLTLPLALIRCVHYRALGGLVDNADGQVVAAPRNPDKDPNPNPNPNPDTNPNP